MGLGQGWPPQEQGTDCKLWRGPGRRWQVRETITEALCAGLVCGPEEKKEPPGDKSCRMGIMIP